VEEGKPSFYYFLFLTLKQQHLPRPPPTVMIAFESGDVMMMMNMVLAMR
jgi:hypothetical protein